MANEEHLKILRQGVEVWNAWREENPRKRPDLAGTNLSRARLMRANLSRTSLFESLLRGTTLNDAILADADLSGAVMTDAFLNRADLSRATLIGADLTRAYLSYVDLRGADLSRADLSDAVLRGAVLDEANLSGTIFAYALFESTVLGFCDLSSSNLKLIRHGGPSVLGTGVLQKSQGQLPAVFLKGCGLSDWEIEAAKLHNPNLSQEERTSILYEIDRLQGQQAIQLNPLFISCSSKDAPFVKALEPKLDELGIRYWRDVHHLKAGRLETQIDRAIRLNPTVLLVLSGESVESDWVEWEVGQARKLEKELKRDVLCPVALDDAWKTCSWPGPLRRQIEDYHILDFSAWKDAGSFEGQFRKLLDGLKLFYRGEE